MSKTTTLEVTAEQKAEIVEAFAKKEEAKEMKKVTLVFQHERNNIKYGPGTIEVVAPIASSLFAADQARFNNRLREHEGGDHLVEIVGAGVTRKIK